MTRLLTLAAVLLLAAGAHAQAPKFKFAPAYSADCPNGQCKTGNRPQAVPVVMPTTGVEVDFRVNPPTHRYFRYLPGGGREWGDSPFPEAAGPDGKCPLAVKAPPVCVGPNCGEYACPANGGQYSCEQCYPNCRCVNLSPAAAPLALPPPPAASPEFRTATTAAPTRKGVIQRLRDAVLDRRLFRRSGCR